MRINHLINFSLFSLQGLSQQITKTVAKSVNPHYNAMIHFTNISREILMKTSIYVAILGKFRAQIQCDLIGRFLKVLVNKFAYKSSPKILVTFGLCRKRSIDVKAVVNIIQATFVNIWETLLLQHLVTLATNKTRKANKSFLAKHYFAYNIRTQQVDLPHKFC